MRQYLNENIRFPEAALNRSINGTCTVVFNVERDGSLTNLRVTKNVVNCPECDQEALRVISTMPPWKPAQRNGSPTGDVFTIPIRFKMDGTANVDPEAVSL